MNGNKQSSNLIFSRFIFQCKVGVLVAFKNPNFSTFFKAAFIFRVCAVFWWRYTNIYLVFSYVQIYLL
jgi:hypothetical protein